MRRLVLSALALASAACGSPTGPDTSATGVAGAAGAMSMAGTAGASGSGAGVGGVEPAPSWSDLPAAKPDPELAFLPNREDQYARLCSKPRNDAFFKRICGDVRPNVPSLNALLDLVGLGQERAFALTGNSTSLVAQSVSALNPRIIVFPRVAPTLEAKDDFTVVGFVRGERFVEVASRDATSGEPNFYLLTFEQRCEYEAGCDLASDLTEAIEHDFTAYSIYAETDLENTSFDCLTCHRPGGFGQKKILRMQELSSPWLHWFPQRFVQCTDSDRLLSAQFAAVHATDKQYGGVPVATIQNALDEGSGAQLEALLRAQGFGEQPNAFDPRIEAEAKSGAESPTWQSQWLLAKQGSAITVPYPRADVTDETKRLAATKAYQDVASGAAARSSLLDLRDVFSADASAKLGFVPDTTADGRALLVQMCARCHDGRADPSLGRSKFNVLKLDQMSADEKQIALTRLQEPEGSAKRMPPWRSGRLTPDALTAALAELAK